MTDSSQSPTRKRYQHTLAHSASLSGRGLHSDQQVKLTLHPASINHGLKFQRVDLPDCPIIPALISFAKQDTQRQTSLAKGDCEVQTIEHILSALWALDIDNALIELTSLEAPICDGSATPFVDLIQRCGKVEQREALVSVFKLRQPVHLQTLSGSLLIALPCQNGLRVSCTFSGSPSHCQLTQFHDIQVITQQNYITEIAPARTFVFFEDVERLRQSGLIKGGSEENAIVMRNGKMDGPERLPNELARHKILDVLGDLALLGMRVDMHIVAVRPGHATNRALVKMLAHLLEEDHSLVMGNESKL